MGKRIVLVLLAFVSTTAITQTRMSVADVDRLVNQHLSPDRLAARLRSIELTQRVSAQRLVRWQSALKNPKARAALQAIADLSASSPLPATELPAAAPPDLPTQQEILSRATEYAASMRPRLPNFSALRTTARFEFASAADLENEERAIQFQQASRAKLDYTSLSNLGHGQHIYEVGVARSRVTYRNGAETLTAEADPQQHQHLTDPGLVSSGEFGSVLSIVDKDATAGTVAWDHWEEGPGKLLAVYRYSVPKNKSHFAVYSPAMLPGMGPGEDHPAYHGEIAVDPADGSIYRILVNADSDPPDPDLLFGVVVEYTPTEIGGKLYICPVHSIAILTRRDPTLNLNPGPLRRYVNDVTFTEYHLFRSESRLIP
jgi:hypothetical protein